MRRFLLLFSFLLLITPLFANPFTGGVGLVIIDAGHGGNDPGASGFGAKEKDITLSVALKLESELKRKGYETLLTRSSDVALSLEDRVKIARSASSELGTFPLFISLHCNSSEGESANGFEVYIKQDSSIPPFYSSNMASNTLLMYSSYNKSQLNRYLNIMNRSFAERIASNLEENTHLRNRGVKAVDFYVLVNNPLVSVLVEMAFISNENESKLLKKDMFQYQIVDSIVDAIEAL